ALIVFTSTFAALATPPLLGLMRHTAPILSSSAGHLTELPPFREWLIGLVPTNPVKAAADGAILPLAGFSIIFGLALARVKSELRLPAVCSLAAVVEALFIVVEWVLLLAPIGVFALSFNIVVRTGTSAAGMFGFFIVLSSLLVVIAQLALYPLVA